MKHLTDDEIQSYLHSDTLDTQARIEGHLDSCAVCQKKLLLYQKLGDMVISASSNPIPENFEMTVMVRLINMQRQKRITDVIVAIVALVGLSIVGAIVLLTPQLKDIVTDYAMDAWQYGIQLTSAANGLTESLAVPLIGIILFVLFTMVDRLAIVKLGLTSGWKLYSKKY